MIPLWLLIVLLACLLHAVANLFDSYFVNKLFKNPIVVVFLGAFVNLILLPFLFIFGGISLPPASALPLLLLLGLTDLIYLYPYYKALQCSDTSIVVALFSLGKLFVPILAFFVVEEKLSLIQYIGFVIIIASSALLSIDDYSKLRLNKSFFWMLLCTFILAVESVVYKYVLETVSWSTSFGWVIIFSLLLVLPILLFKKHRTAILSSGKLFKKYAHLLIIEDLLTIGGTAAFTFPLTLASVTLVNGIGAVQSAFVLVLGILLQRLFPKAIKEKLTVHNIILKIFLFAVIAVGVLLIV